MYFSRGVNLLLKGLYKFAFKTARGAGCGVMFATESGKLYGGNSGSSFIGSYTMEGGEIVSGNDDVPPQPRSRLHADVSRR